MRGCKVTISLPVFLKVLGLDDCGNIHLSNVGIEEHLADTFYLCLNSETNEELPELEEGSDFPPALIECERIQSRIRML